MSAGESEVWSDTNHEPLQSLMGQRNTWGGGEKADYSWPESVSNNLLITQSPMTDSHWYALKVFYNRLNEILNELTDAGVETFVPMATYVVERNGHRMKVRKPMISSLLFFRCDDSRTSEIERQLSQRASIYKRAGSGRIPAPIPDRQMEIFRLVTGGSETEGLEYLGAETSRYAVGQRVIVTGGPFEGAEGTICRIKGNRRLVVTINGVCAVATSYIPACFLQKIES